MPALGLWGKLSQAVVAGGCASALIAGSGLVAANATVLRAGRSGGTQAGHLVTVAGGAGGPGPAAGVALGVPCTATFWRGSLYLDGVVPAGVGGGALIRKI